MRKLKEVNKIALALLLLYLVFSLIDILWLNLPRPLFTLIGTIWVLIIVLVNLLSKLMRSKPK
jgi:hypothetical protein